MRFDTPTMTTGPNPDVQRQGDEVVLTLTFGALEAPNVAGDILPILEVRETGWPPVLVPPKSVTYNEDARTVTVAYPGTIPAGALRAWVEWQGTDNRLHGVASHEAKFRAVYSSTRSPRRALRGGGVQQRTPLATATTKAISEMMRANAFSRRSSRSRSSCQPPAKIKSIASSFVILPSSNARRMDGWFTWHSP